MKYIPIIMALFLVSCTTSPGPILTKEKSVVFIPDSSLFDCPLLDRFPDPTTLTDGQIAELLAILYRNNITCSDSITAIEAQLLEAQARLEAPTE